MSVFNEEEFREGLVSELELCNLPSTQTKEGPSGAVDRVSDFGPRGPWFDSPPVHISLWP